MFLLAALMTLVLSDPTGSPICSAIDSRIHTSIQPASVNLGYKLEATPGPNNTYFVKLTGTRPDYQGLLLYITSTSKPNIHLGGWTFQNTQKFRFVDRNLCRTQGILQQTYATVTHANPARIALNSRDTVFKWFPIDKSEVGLSDLTVVAVVASQDNGQGGKARWQRIAGLDLTKISAASSPPPTTTATASTGNSTVTATTSVVVETGTGTATPTATSAAFYNTYPGFLTVLALLM